MVFKLSIIPENAEEYWAAAKHQLKAEILDKSCSKYKDGLTASEWQKVSSAWLLIRCGIYTQHLSQSMLKYLRTPAIRDEAEVVARRYGITLSKAAEITGNEKSLAAYEKFDSARPLLVTV